MPRDIRDVSRADPLFVDDPTSSQIKLADGSFVDMIGTTMSKWAADFNTVGGGLDPDKWDIVRQTGGMTLSTVGGVLNMVTGVTANAELLLLGKTVATIPANLSAAIMRSNTTIAAGNNYIRMGYVEVDPTTQLPVPHPTLPTDFRNRVGFGQGRAGAADNTSTWFLEAISGGGPIKQVATGSISASSSLVDVSLEVRPDDLNFSNRGADNTGSLSGSGLRLSSVVPDPNKLYRPYVWLVNGTAPAAGSSITVTIWRMLSMDIQEMQAEIGGGRGNATSGQALPVIVAGGSVTLANAAASASGNSTTLTSTTSAATTNPRNIKTTGGKIIGGQLTNFTASWRYLKIYNKATAPVPGTDTPVYTIPIPPNAIVQLGTVFDQYGLYLSTGISIALTGALADLDATAIGAGDIHYGLIYV